MSSEWVARLRSQRGNTLLLMPAAVLVLFVLAAIAVDAAVLFLGQRRLADLAASVAQDAVAAVDHEGFYGASGADPELRIDEAEARARRDTLSASLPRDDAFLDPRCDVVTEGLRADVVCSARVRFVFAPAVFGADRLSEVRATESAVGRRG